MEVPKHHQHEDVLRYAQQLCFAICATGDWWYQLDNWLEWVWWLPCFEDALGSWSWRNSLRFPEGLLVALVRSSSFGLNQAVLEGSTIFYYIAESRTVFIWKTSDTNDFGRIIRSLDARRPLTLFCNCDCKLLASAICRGLTGTPWDSLTSQRWISSRQMTDNIFEIDTAAVVHVACAPQEPGDLLIDFDVVCPNGSHSWMCSVLENTVLTAFLCRSPLSTLRDSIIYVELGGAEWGHLCVTRAVRQGFLASGVFFLWLLTRTSDGSKS